MAIYALSDLHLALSNPEKSMSVFGPGWENYIERIKEGFDGVVKPEDTVLMPGDLSWATYLKDAKEDFEFIDNLPGKKIISRGNHDYWWNTIKKMEETFKDMGLSTITIARNNVIEAEDCLISGTRGWKVPGDDGFGEEDKKIYDREVIRLGLCLDAIAKEDPEHSKKHVIMMHYPPLTKNAARGEFTTLLENANVDMVIYGHLHGRAHAKVFEGKRGNTEYRCVSADYCNYRPFQLFS
ncbi:MAG: metallophosphoesterase [Saccharofermentans sp.]|nr:metallophosphoesterase [Saccharofermentans sp.]